MKRAIACGFLRPGDQLPSVRELAVSLTVNPNTVARAYRELEREDVLFTQRGRGTFVTASAPDMVRRQRRARLVARLQELMREALSLGLSVEQFRVLMEEVLAAQIRDDGAATNRQLDPGCEEDRKPGGGDGR